MIGGPPDRVTAVALLAADAVLRRIRSGRLELVLPDGSRRSYGATGGRQAELEVLDWAFLRRLARSPRVALGEGFQAGEWQTPDLVGLLELLADNYNPIAGEGPLAALSRLRGLVPRPRLRHGLRSSQQDVQAHYDLSNEFFALWLDPSLTYSCAVFEEPDQSLEEAQQHKYRLLCDRLELGSHHHLLEIGSGWGGMALHAARTRGCRVTTDHDLDRAARARVAARRRGRSRRPRGGARARLPQAHRALRPDRLDRDARGDRPRSAADVLPRDRPAARPARRGRDPDDHDPRAALPLVSPVGGLAATPHLPRRSAPVGRRDRARVRRATQLGVYRLDEIGPHYAPTLGRWRERFLERVAEVRALGFDERFCRTWEFYLAYCEAAFASRAIRDVQLVLARPFEREAPIVLC